MATMDSAQAPEATNSPAAAPAEVPQESTLDSTTNPESAPENHAATSAATEDAAADASATNAENSAVPAADSAAVQPPITKNQMKKLKRQAMWAERKEDRKRQRKDKRHEKQAHKRAELANKIAEAEAAGLDPKEVLAAERKGAEKARPQTVPVTFIMDCDFEQYMNDKELVSLSSQVVRSYSENRKSRIQAHLVVCPWGGKLKERFETTLANHHKGWKNIQFLDQDFVQAGKAALELMKGPNGGKLIGALAPKEDTVMEDAHASGAEKTLEDPTPVPEPEKELAESSIVYLTSDSPYTLERLEPNTSYVIGGIVDRNRQKGLCYKRACENGVRTAKLPITDYLVMASRQVLTTNQVLEIMLKWLECGDWKVAFQYVIPKRKGAVVKEENSEAGPAEENEQDGDDYNENNENGNENDNEAGNEVGEEKEEANGGTGAASNTHDPAQDKSG
ncbi:tRNA (guanine-N(1)-)-methyltransferase [Pyricularia oryzae 70-15]|uniref:tRNA (guanine(9)-N1)-methyltransferase n=3 Tax=Pyricularia oryzae TaxID=318829 RepID=G4NDR7_PYRO7|nr:tRNA (guanine-N(1)-)-methyltransferase [Pyricularia oryzae 70-15]EHA48505.1 tRNA (guanine-N(1)-)-methyltransferase [Pyricularia oryzae 70-15]